MITIEFTYNPFELELIIWDVDFTDKYPKSYKVYKSFLHTYDFVNNTQSKRIFTRITAGLNPDKVNDGKNETGLNRIKKFIEKTKKIDEIQIIESPTNKITRNAIHELPRELFE